MTRRDRLIAWLCARLGAHVRGRCGCPICDTTERDARAAIGMAARHPGADHPRAARRAGGMARRPGRRAVARGGIHRDHHRDVAKGPARDRPGRAGRNGLPAAF